MKGFSVTECFRVAYEVARSLDVRLESMRPGGDGPARINFWIATDDTEIIERFRQQMIKYLPLGYIVDVKGYS